MRMSAHEPLNPFNFGDIALDEGFTDREAELRELEADIRNGQNVVVFAPRRFGKTSLVWRAAQEVAGSGEVLVAQVDLMRTVTKEQLAAKLAEALYEHVATPLYRVRERAQHRRVVRFRSARCEVPRRLDGQSCASRDGANDM